MATEQTLDAKAAVIVDIAMDAVTLPASGEARTAFRTEMQNAVEALVDECREYYRELFSPPKEGG